MRELVPEVAPLSLLAVVLVVVWLSRVRARYGSGFCREVDAECAITEVFEKGGAGALELAAKAMALADRSYNREIVSLYPAALSIEQKIERVAKEMYSAHSVHLESAPRHHGWNGGAQ